MKRPPGVVLSVLALAVVALVAPTPAVAAGDPAGTVTLASGPSIDPHGVELDAATPESVVYIEAGGVVAQRRDTRAKTVLTPYGYGPVAAGSVVLFTDSTGSSQVHRWYDTSTGRGGLAPARWVAPAPTGGLIVKRLNARTMRVSVQNAVTGDVRTVVDVPYAGADSNFSVVSGGDGVVVTYYPNFGGSGPSFLGYAPYAGSGLRSYDLGAVATDDLAFVQCAAPTSTVIACKGGVSVFDVPIAGRAVSVVATLPNDFAVRDVVVSTAAVGWVDYRPDAQGNLQTYLFSVPIAGGTVSRSARVVLSDVVSDGATLLECLGTNPQDAGIYSTPDARTRPTRVVPLGAERYAAEDIAIAPGGRVVYVDNRAHESGWQRTLSRTGSTVGIGAERSAMPGVEPTYATLAVSGARTEYTTPVGATVTSPLQPTAVVPNGSDLSGTRVAYEDRDGPQITDLNTGSVSPSGVRATMAVLWGDELTYAKRDGSVWRADLADPTAARRLLAPTPSSVTTVDLLGWGDWIAVVRFDSSTATPALVVLNVRTGVTRTVTGHISSLTAAGAAGYVEGSTLHSWDGAHSLTVNGGHLVPTASVVAWIGADLLPHAAPVPWVTDDRPRSLGNPLAPATVHSGAGWTFDLPTSAPLTSCVVDLLQGTTVVRTLGCDTAYTRGGDAVVTWDTTRADGSAAPLGTYKWRVRASNADGPLLLASGAAGTVSGTFTVTRAS